MPRRSASSQPRQGMTMTSQESSSSRLVSRMLRKEEALRNGIKENHNFACVFAHRLKRGGELESMLGDLGEHRERLKELGKTNVQQERNVTAFMAALEYAQSHEEEIEDFHEALEKTMASELKKQKRVSSVITQDEMYQELCTKLGEKVGDAAEEDEELEVLNEESTQDLKCPVMGMLMEDPVKNKVCGHVYSKVGIHQHIKINKKCPVPGCSNNNVQANHLEPDAQTTQLIRREKIRQEHARVQMSQNAIDADELEDTM